MLNNPTTGFVIWFTGLPASGKTTIARAVHEKLKERGVLTAHLESDHLRTIFTPQPTYSTGERDWFYSVLIFLGRLLSDHGVNVLLDATANLRRYRNDMRRSVSRFIEVYIRCPLEVCQQRDPKGIYAASRAGKSATVPGVDEPYEEPEHAEVTVDSQAITPERAAEEIIERLEQLGWIPSVRTKNA